MWAGERNLLVLEKTGGDERVSGSAGPGILISRLVDAPDIVSTCVCRGVKRRYPLILLILLLAFHRGLQLGPLLVHRHKLSTLHMYVDAPSSFVLNHTHAHDYINNLARSTRNPVAPPGSLESYFPPFCRPSCTSPVLRPEPVSQAKKRSAFRGR